MRSDFSTAVRASHVNITLINCEQQRDESLKSFFCKWELLLQSCCISAKNCIDKLKIDLFSSQLLNEKIARRVIYKHHKTVPHAFHIAKEVEIEVLIKDHLSSDNVYHIAEIN